MLNTVAADDRRRARLAVAANNGRDRRRGAVGERADCDGRRNEEEKEDDREEEEGLKTSRGMGQPETGSVGWGALGLPVCVRETHIVV